MKLFELKNYLKSLDTLSFQLPDGKAVPQHFHITEVGKLTKHFIDCSGVIREESIVNFQLWCADDFNHKLKPRKFLNIIKLSERKLNIDDNLEIIIEYQGKSIEKYGLDFIQDSFVLNTLKTDCLDKEKCVIPDEKPKLKLSEIQKDSCCSTDDNCC